MSEDRDQTRRLREAFATTRPEDAPTPECPPAEQLWDGAQNALGPRELRRVLSHVAVCPVCTESWRLAVAIAGDEAGPVVVEPAGEAASRATSRVGWASAAAATVAFMAFALVYEGPTQGSPVRSAGVRAPASGLVLRASSPTPGCRFEWTGVPGASYDVQVLNDRLELVAEARNLDRPYFEVPEELLRSLPQGRDLRLYVAARRGPDGVAADATFDVGCPGRE